MDASLIHNCTLSFKTWQVRTIPQACTNSHCAICYCDLFLLLVGCTTASDVAIAQLNTWMASCVIRQLQKEKLQSQSHSVNGSFLFHNFKCRNGDHKQLPDIREEFPGSLTGSWRDVPVQMPCDRRRGRKVHGPVTRSVYG